MCECVCASVCVCECVCVCVRVCERERRERQRDRDRQTDKETERGSKVGEVRAKEGGKGRLKRRKRNKDDKIGVYTSSLERSTNSVRIACAERVWCQVLRE